MKLFNSTSKITPGITIDNLFVKCDLVRGHFNPIAATIDRIVEIIKHDLPILHDFDGLVIMSVVDDDGMMDTAHINDVRKRMKYTEDCVCIGCC